MEFNWYLQGDSDTELGKTDTLLFCDETFESPIKIRDCNESTHVRTIVGIDKSSENSPNNVKYISGTEADWGDGIEDLDQIQDSECTLKIVISDVSSFQITHGKFYAFSDDIIGATDGLEFYSAESGDSNWTQSEGQGNALDLGDKSADTTHNYFISASICISDGGTNNGQMRFEGLIE
jgi:hypothetical protein